MTPVEERIDHAFESETFWDRYPAIHFVAAMLVCFVFLAAALVAAGFYAHAIWLTFQLGWSVLS